MADDGLEKGCAHGLGMGFGCALSIVIILFTLGLFGAWLDDHQPHGSGSGAGSGSSDTQLAPVTQSPPVSSPPANLSPNLTESFYVGQDVAVKWNNGLYYHAAITRVNDYTYDVLCADGDKGTVTAQDLIPIPATPNLSIGDQVLGSGETAMMEPGIVQGYKNGYYSIKLYKDGSIWNIPNGAIVKY